MQIRNLGDTDLNLSVVGLGTWAIGGDGWDYGWGPQDDVDSVQAILEALEHGINWIDTAAIYGLGHSEKVVGKALKEYGERVIVATKCGLIGDAKGHVTANITRESILHEVEMSLRRLQLQTIDLYQIHWPPDCKFPGPLHIVCFFRNNRQLKDNLQFYLREGL